MKFFSTVVRFIFGGIITLLIIPAAGIFVLIRGVWKIMDKILDLIEPKEKNHVEEREKYEDSENYVQKIN
ncbi:MAG: hypothetical protein NC078_06150 [Ruminococcus sp.]|nr:hypothetical protein [Ruminococcus sp.]